MQKANIAIPKSSPRNADGKKEKKKIETQIGIILLSASKLQYWESYFTLSHGRHIRNENPIHGSENAKPGIQLPKKRFKALLP
jgi:hypothetical protein